VSSCPWRLLPITHDTAAEVYVEVYRKKLEADSALAFPSAVRAITTAVSTELQQDQPVIMTSSISSSSAMCSRNRGADLLNFSLGDPQFKVFSLYLVIRFKM
jgi:cystathionine beta-lyase/cystathionine gamma-synthase